VAARRPRVFTIPASAPFLPTLIRSLAEGHLVPGFPEGADALAMSRATIYLPTNRACRLARDLFLDAIDREAAVLPRIVALGDIDEDELAFAQAATGLAAEAGLELPPALGSTERRLLLARLVLQWAASKELHGAGGAPLVAQSPAAAVALADNLARLMDDMTTRQVSWDRLDDLVPERFDKYWQLSLSFLKIAREAWPAILEERGLIEAAARRDRLIAAERTRLAGSSMAVIAAGSTGSMPATAALLATIANHPNGAVVLPGLDTDLDDASWHEIAARPEENREPLVGHPQFAMHGLLSQIGMTREMVVALAPPANPSRARVASEAFRPAATTDRWQIRLDDGVLEEAAAGLTIIEAANAEEEALAIAVALRGAIEPAGARAALVTADRPLGRRVAAALARWNVAVEESGGIALTETKAGTFARLAAQAGLSRSAPVSLLALLKHPHFRLGRPADWYAAAIETLERAVLRGPPPRPGSAGLTHALAAFRRDRARLHPNDPRSTLTQPELDAAAALLHRLRAALAPLEGLPTSPRRFGEIAGCHRDVITELGLEGRGALPAFAGDDGNVLAATLDDLVARLPADDLLVAPPDYSDLFRETIAERLVRRAPVPGAQVRILGPLESRLQGFDTVILGGLIEGSWPPDARNDPWLSRPMRHALGLDLPERRIGLSAHDFAQALGTPTVILTRAAKIAGAPTVASRFLRRLAAVVGEPQWQKALARGESTLALARMLDQSPAAPRLEAPQPRPPRDARPTYLTVTDVEHWLRDPYTIYAKHVLRLLPLDPVNTPPGARDRGTVIHGAVGDFTKAFAAQWPADPLGELLALGRQHFAPLEDYPEARAFWWPRFLRIARWFLTWDGARRAEIAETYAEIRGEIAIPLADRTFRLAARADRIDRLADGRYAVIDYKTGEARTEKQVRIGLAPQLTLEAAILRHGGFAEVPAGASIAELLYVTLKGGDPPGKLEPIEFKEGTPDTQSERALARFTELVRRFDHENQPFRSLVHPMWKWRYGDYDHLARVKEWSATGAIDEGGE